MTRTPLPASDVLSVEFDGHVAIVWLDRPDARNAFAPDFWADFPEVMDSISGDPDTRAVVIAARGPSFTVGIDLKAFGPAFVSGGVDPASLDPSASAVSARMALYRSIKAMQRTFSSIADCAKPVIAAVHGHCIGAGVDLITACDIRYASDDATFSVRETRLAMVADVGTLQRLPRIVDAGRVAEIVYTGRDFDAAEALEMGLVTRTATSADEVLSMAMDTARAVAANSPLAVQGAKAVLKAGEGLSVEQHLDYVALWNSSFFASRDLTEAAMAFLEKRDPDFTGQ
jgi:enoyl-CoA hydratase